MNIQKKLDTYSKLSTKKRINGMAQGTKNFIARYLRDYLEYTNNINKDSFIDFLINKELAYSTKSAIALQVGKFLVFASLFSDDDYKFIKKSFRFPRKQWEVPLTIADIVNIYDSIGTLNTTHFTRIRNRCMVSFFVTTGARLSQVLNLDNKDVNVYDNYISINIKKQKEIRRTIEVQYEEKKIPCDIHVADYVIGDMINSYINIRGDTMGPFFVSYKNNRLSVAYVEKLMRLIREKLDISLTPHSFRRFVAATVADKHGIHKAAILLGHASIETTMRYINPKTVDTQEIINNILE